VVELYPLLKTSYFQLNFLVKEADLFKIQPPEENRRGEVLM